MLATNPPRWNLSTIFPSLDSKEFQDAFDRLGAELEGARELFDRHSIGRNDNPTVDAKTASVYDEITNAANSLSMQFRTLHAYVQCIITTDAKDEIAKSRDSLLNSLMVKLDQLCTRYVAWVGTHDAAQLLSLSAVAQEHEFAVLRSAEMAAHQMTEAEENLASDLRTHGLTAWARLHGNMSALLSAEVEIRGERKTLPMSSIRALSSDPSRATRKAAFEAETKAWETVEVPLAASLNSIKGFQAAVRKRRGYVDDVEPTLAQNSIDRPTLEAMQQACVESFPDFRLYLAAKARSLGLERLAWYDISAPVGQGGSAWTWKNAERYIVDSFRKYSQRLADFAERTFAENWIDAEPRVGKEGGAYCAGLQPGVSRIMMNFDGSFISVSTLAHELGHGYHNLCLENRTAIQRRLPSTFAETASIFCETLSIDSAIGNASPSERLMLLDTSLERDLGVVVDIHSRFLFEKRVFEVRSERDLSITELNNLMTNAQRETYGNDLECLHPYMWCVKGHYYGPTFYNYPYTFGLLFGLGLYAQYKAEPESFRSRYDDLLSSTGMADAKTLGKRFGIDVASVDFWRASLDVIRGKIGEFENLVT